ncbi:hypothetical protein [Mesorhizobium sp. CAU 1741]|uniref:hypothetical protein n=1 Tax=Mesorhizobium sp. CAU 1741 TaxID=3140366 RepID=UPI00325B99E6
MKRIGLIIAASLLAATAAQAQNRPDSRSLSCGQVQSLIEDRGAVVMTTGQHTYDRFVRNRWQCFSTAEVGVRTHIASQDTGSCPVYRCEVVDPVDRRYVLTR